LLEKPAVGAASWFRSPSSRGRHRALRGAIVVAGIRIVSRSSTVLVDEAPPPDELDHELRARRAKAAARAAPHPTGDDRRRDRLGRVRLRQERAASVSPAPAPAAP